MSNREENIDSCDGKESSCCIDEKADYLYSPSRWPSHSRPIKTRSAVIGDYCQRANEIGAECLRQYGNSMSTIEYGSKINEKIVIIHPEERSRNMSLFAYIHGGYWQDGSYKFDGMVTATPVLNAGHMYAAIGYNDDIQMTLTDITAQVVRAVDCLADFTSQHNVRSIIFSGHSAGAHLVAMTIISPELNVNARSLVKGVALLGGVYDITPLVNTSINIPGLGLTDVSVAEKLSPSHLLKSQAIVVENLAYNLVSYAAEESPAFHTQSKDFAKLLEHRSIPVSVYECPDRDHFNMITDIPAELAQLLVKLMEDH